MGAHDLLSPSSRHRWARCPGSVRESAKYPPSPSGPAAIDGTHSHTLLEKSIISMSCPTLSIGVRMIDHEGEFEIDRARAERVKIAFDYVMRRAVESGFGRIIQEQRVDPLHLLGREGMAGTCDVQIHGNDGILELIDYKDGMAPVDAKDNEQLEQYGYGVLSSFKLPVNVEYPWHTLRMTIIQPKLALKGLPTISSHDVSVREFLARAGTIIAQAHATAQPDAPLVPGEVQCKHCPAKGSCAARSDETVRKLNLPSLDPQTIADATNADANTLSDERLQQILDAAPLLRQMLESAEEEAQRRMQAGRTVPGYKLVRGRGTRAWAYDPATTAEKLIKFGIPKSALYTETLVSPAQAEKLTWTKRDGTEMRLSENQIKLMAREYITKTQGKVTIAPLSDPREAITVDTSAAELFKPVNPVTDPIPEWLK